MRSRVLVPTLALAALALSGCKVDLNAAASGAPDAPGAGTAAPARGVSGDHAAALAALGAPRPEDTGAHYDRDDWGDWAYDSKSKCDTRESILVRDGDGETVDSQCRSACPKEACWTSRYDGVTAKDPHDLQIDHIVPLAEAARSGARDWTPAQRKQFYNDQENLVAVTVRSNTQKSDGDPGKWRPALQTYWCDYVTGYVAIKTKYKLSVDDNELAGITAMFRSCG
ncbi:HNH endonuclease family protein [Actinokineospora enzanensis]|uniref:HNH endonuclease family protein n=1 Tax=Actinokineospora enzanensis TaxID=155975 RepID=UPI000524F037|nr:HNH endonuclease family protein [Actinokineospora enzanensis]